MIRTVKAFDLKGQRILMRVDFNVPIENGRVTDEFLVLCQLYDIVWMWAQRLFLCLI